MQLDRPRAQEELGRDLPVGPALCRCQHGLVLTLAQRTEWSGHAMIRRDAGRPEPCPRTARPWTGTEPLEDRQRPGQRLPRLTAAPLAAQHLPVVQVGARLLER